MSITDSKPYCSLDCFPDEALDRLYSFEYTKLVDAYRDFVNEMSYISNYEKRIELENDVDSVLEEYKSIRYFQDTEDSFYKGEIFTLYDKLLSLADEIHNVLLKANEIDDATILFWSSIFLDTDMSNEYATKISNEILENLKVEGILFLNRKNRTFSPYNKAININNYKDILCTVNKEEQKKLHSICINVFQRNTKNNVDIYNKLFDGEEESDSSLYIYSCKVQLCPVCEDWEEEEEFSFNGDKNISVCDCCSRN